MLQKQQSFIGYSHHMTPSITLYHMTIRNSLFII